MGNHRVCTTRRRSEFVVNFGRDSGKNVTRGVKASKRNTTRAKGDSLRLSGAARSVAMTASDSHRAIDAVWRIESARLIAGLARIVRDVGLAQALAQAALVAALEQWPESGVPHNPGAWLFEKKELRPCVLLSLSYRDW